MYELMWLESSDPLNMLRFLRGKGNKRRLRLFSMACIREGGHLLSDRRARSAYFVGERHADGQASLEEIRQAATEARHVWVDLRSRDSFWHGGDYKVCCRMVDVAYALATATDPFLDPWSQAWRTASALHGIRGDPAGTPVVTNDSLWTRQNMQIQCDLLRDIFGHPSGGSALDRSWLRSRGREAVGIATSIYEDRSFEELPVLADALMDADCPYPELVQHCQEPGLHGRGCWVVDCLLSKK